MMELEGVNLTTYFLGLLAGLLCYKFFKLHWTVKLPGPRRWPFLGTMLSFDMARMMHDDQLLDVARRYGDICALRAFGEDFILLNSYDVIREAAILKPMDFVNRKLGHGFTWKQVDPHGHGIANADFERIREVRSASLSIFRDLGVGRATMEDIVDEEARILLDQFQSEDSKSFNPRNFITFAAFNVIMHVTIKKHFDANDEETKKFLRECYSSFSSGRYIILLDLLPFLRYVPFFKNRFHEIVDGCLNVKDFMTKHAAPALDKFREKEVECDAQSYAEAYTAKYGFDSYEVKTVLPQTYIQFLFAGTETTTTSLLWTLCLLANRPNIQQKLHEALFDILGESGHYRLSCKIPYLDAVVWEIQRFCSIIPIALPHAASSK